MQISVRRIKDLGFREVDGSTNPRYFWYSGEHVSRRANEFMISIDTKGSFYHFNRQKGTHVLIETLEHLVARMNKFYFEQGRKIQAENIKQTLAYFPEI